MDHDWKESWSAGLESLMYKCRVCTRYLVVRKQDATFHSPSEDEDLLEKNNISPDCNVEQVRLVMES